VFNNGVTEKMKRHPKLAIPPEWLSGERERERERESARERETQHCNVIHRDRARGLPGFSFEKRRKKNKN